MSPLRLCLVSPFALDGAHPVAEHVRGAARQRRPAIFGGFVISGQTDLEVWAERSPASTRG